MINPVHLNTTSPILACMDSGMGGIAYLDYLVERAPNVSFVFVGDTQWMPYGDKPKHVVRDRVLSIVDWFSQGYSLAAFVIACNTATGATKEVLDESKLGCPLLTPIHVTADYVKRHYSNTLRVGVLATKLSVEGHHYQHAFGPDWQVSEVACPGLADVIERGFNQGPELETVLEPFIRQLKAAQPEIVVLGCTHYSLISSVIQHHMGDSIPIVDCSDVLAQWTMQFLQKMDIQPGPRRILVTHDAEGFAQALKRLPFKHMGKHAVEVLSLATSSSTLPIP